MKNYFGYIRVSTVRQGERGISLQEQRDAIERYARANDLVISKWFEERITAAKTGRPLFMRMLADIRAGKAHGVVIHKIDRSARNLRDWAGLGELLDQGIDVRFAHEGLDLNSRGGRLSADIQAVVAADFIRNLREETRKGFYGRLKQGLYPLAAPIGYKDNGGGQPKTICPRTGPLIREAFELYATGEYSLQTLANEMQGRGLRRPNGEPLHLSLWARVLKNPFYMGIIRLASTGETFPGIHAPLVSKKTFDQVADVLAGRQPKRYRIHQFTYRQLIRCHRCGNLLIGERQKGHVYYRCHTRGCHTSCVREELLDEAIAKELSPLQFTQREIQLLKVLLEHTELSTDRMRDESMQALELQEQKVDSHLERLTDALITGLISKDVFEKRHASLLTEKKGLEERMAELKRKRANNEQLKARILELANSLVSAYDLAEPDAKRDLCENVFSNRAVDGKEPCFSMHFTYQVLRDRPSLLSSAPSRCTTRTFGEWARKLVKVLIMKPDRFLD